jgi:hypothetical protein
MSRCPDATLVEVMVVDQRVHQTADVHATLHVDKLVVSLSPTAAAALDGVVEYLVLFSPDQDELRQLDAALAAIFAAAGRYDGRFRMVKESKRYSKD